MITYFKRKLPVLYLLTATAFLLIYSPGDKFSVFNFMLIPFYILMIIDGQGGILGLSISPYMAFLVDLIVIGSLIYALFLFIKAGFRNSELSKIKALNSLGILISFGLFMIFGTMTFSILSLGTYTIFFSLALITFVTVVSKGIKKNDRDSWPG